MELRHLRYFLAVAEELHFHRAATRLHISQPPLSQQIRALERELGVTLLERNRRRVALTAAGEAFRDDTRAILAAVDRASERAQNIARGSIGTLSIGFVGSAMFSPTLPDILREFRSSRPDVELVLRELPTVVQLQALVGGELDVGVIRGPIAASELDPQLELMTIQRERLVAALPADHPLAARRRLRAADLRGETFVILARREAPGLFASLSAAMGEVGGVPDDVLEVAEMQTIISLVAGGFGVSLVPASVGSVDRSGVAFRPFVGPAPTIELVGGVADGGRLTGARCVSGAGAVDAQGARLAAAKAAGSRAPKATPLNVQDLREGSRGFAEALHGGRRGSHRVGPDPWYVQYRFFLAVSRLRNQWLSALRNRLFRPVGLCARFPCQTTLASCSSATTAPSAPTTRSPSPRRLFPGQRSARAERLGAARADRRPLLRRSAPTSATGSATPTPASNPSR